MDCSEEDSFQTVCVPQLLELGSVKGQFKADSITV